MAYVERITKIHSDDFSYVVRPNEDTESAATDIAYEEGGKELRYICVQNECLPALIEALQARLSEVVRFAERLGGK